VHRDEAELRQLPVATDPEIASGALVFRGTRVPVDALIENLEAGLTLDEFLENFPTIHFGEEPAFRPLCAAGELAPTRSRLGPPV
jgi:uncharacterized protein (DUF433 family)